MAARTENSPERFSGDESGRLIASEHRARYAWAAGLAASRKVLDAGCGTGYGLGILERGGAAQLVGIDLSEEAVARARDDNASADVEVLQGDVRALPFADGEFDLVVCFEVIEHVDDRDAVLDELARVVSASGIVCISTPNRRVYPAGNPHHIYEYEPDEFARTLATRFSHIALRRQTAWLASAVLTDDEFTAAVGEEPLTARTIKSDAKDLGQETFTIALASHAPAESPQSLVMLGDAFEVQWWASQVRDASSEARDAADRAVARRDAALREVAALRHQLRAAHDSSLASSQKLLAVEEELAQRKARVVALETAYTEREQELVELVERVSRADRVLAAMQSSWSWKVTAPLRILKRTR
jgi:O-antigen biosynthesis protein